MMCVYVSLKGYFVPKPRARSFSAYASEALHLLAASVRVARKQRGLTLAELAERAGISRSLAQRIENGDPGCAIGPVFEVATIVGVPLFEDSAARLSARLDQTRQLGALLPKSVRVPPGAVDDEF